MDLDGRFPYNISIDPLVSNGIGGHLLSQFILFTDNSLYQTRSLHIRGNIAIQEAFSCCSKLAGALAHSLSSSSNFNTVGRLSNSPYGSKAHSIKASTPVRQISSPITKLCSNFKLSGRFLTADIFRYISKFAIKFMSREAKRIQSIPLLTLAAALVPPFENISLDELTIPMENGDMKLHGCINQSSCNVEHRGCPDLSFLNLKWSSIAVEPRTGIEFPAILDNICAGENNSTLNSKVLVGTGSRIMKVAKVKSLKLYAFGFYVHPHSVCIKLSKKYASIPHGELNKCQNFYKDLLREDIGMTVRLVISYNGMKINSVKDAFEKSLRARLKKMNPNTDYQCLRAFGSHFTQDIPLPVGTTVDFRRTSDGQLITEIGGSQIGAVCSKDLCRAFFDMYIGDGPISEQTKGEIGQNVASIMRNC